MYNSWKIYKKGGKRWKKQEKSIFIIADEKRSIGVAFGFWVLFTGLSFDLHKNTY